MPFTLYDDQTRSMLKTPQTHLKAGSQNFAHEQPASVKRGKDLSKGFFPTLKPYSPLPALFDKSLAPEQKPRWCDSASFVMMGSGVGVHLSGTTT